MFLLSIFKLSKTKVLEKHGNGILCLVCLIIYSKSEFMASGCRIQDSGRGLWITLLLPGNWFFTRKDLKKFITLKALYHVPSNGQGSVCSYAKKLNTLTALTFIICRFGYLKVVSAVSVVKVMGKFQSHCKNVLQHLCYIIFLQIVTCNMQYYWISGFSYIIRQQSELFSNFSISNEHARKVWQNKFQQNTGF